VESGKQVTGEKFCMSITAVTNAVKHITLHVIFATIAAREKLRVNDFSRKREPWR